MSKTGETFFKNLQANAARFFEVCLTILKHYSKSKGFIQKVKALESGIKNVEPSFLAVEVSYRRI